MNLGSGEAAQSDALWSTEGEFGSEVSDDLLVRIKAELEPGERLLWVGRSDPPPERFGWGYLLFGTIASFFFLLGSAAIADALGRFGRRPPEQSTMAAGLAFYGVAGVIVISVIASQIKSRADRRAAANVSYAVTDRRVISWVPEWQMGGVRVMSLPRGEIVDVMRVERPDGSGNLEFTRSEHAIRHNFRATELKNIPAVHRVELIIRKNLIANEEIVKKRDSNLDS
jgi:hypothetical protein